ncbi:hypothetical protein VI26_16675 [Chromobacterium sp. LK1]|nr:hypothetical protein VI26_16675 [Chromobacterium sp. LK1]
MHFLFPFYNICLQSFTQAFDFNFTMHKGSFDITMPRRELFLTLGKHFFTLLLLFLKCCLACKLLLLSTFSICIELMLLVFEHISIFANFSLAIFEPCIFILLHKSSSIFQSILHTRTLYLECDT